MGRLSEWGGVAAAVVAIVGSSTVAAWVLSAGSAASGRNQAAPSEAPRGFTAPADALLLGARSRDVLVGLSVRPGGPVLLRILPAGRPLARGRVEATLAGAGVPVGRCGKTCFRVDASVLTGREQILRITVRRPRALPARARFELPARLPPRAGRIFRAAARRMRTLAGLRIDQTLTSGLGGSASARYLVQPPDRLSFRTSDGIRSVIVGPRRWDLQPEGWVQSRSEQTRLPTYPWATATHARLLGTARLRGNRVRELALYKAGRSGSWFRLLVDDDARVLRAEMLTPGHFMTDRYSGFDAAIRIRPPR